MKILPKKISQDFPSQFLKIGQQIFEAGDYDYFDFIRDSYTAKFTDKRGTYWTTLRKTNNGKYFQGLCSCNAFMQSMKCQHIVALFVIIYSKDSVPKNIENTLAKYYEESLWNNISRICYDYFDEKGLDIEAGVKETDGEIEYFLSGEDHEKNKIFEFIVPDNYKIRLIQKYRYLLFDNLRDDQIPENTFDENFQFLPGEKTDLEIRMNESGYKSWLQKFEDSYWFDIGKSWFLGYDKRNFSVEYSEKTQSLIIISEGNKFKFHFPKKQAPRILQKLAQNENVKKSLNISDDVILLNYSLEITDQHDLRITPVLEVPGEDPIFLSEKNKKKPVVGSLFNFEEVHIPNKKIFKLIREYKKYIDAGDFFKVSPALQIKDLYQQVKSVDVFVDKMKEDWLYLSLKYRIGDDTVSLYDIYNALREGRRYLIGKKVWLDLNQLEFKWIQNFLSDESVEFELSGNTAEKNLKIKKMNFIKLNAHLPLKSKIKTRRTLEEVVENLTKFRPISQAPDLNQFKYKLREYQKNGFQWLWFLYENNLSGLLCDDMGLGKTYQSLALIDAMTIYLKRNSNFLVVTPTSVLPHWEDKLSQLKKKTNLILYFGAGRNLDTLNKNKYNIILTSYGILRNDLEQLAEIDFELAVFDEIQTAKNKSSLTNAALNQLNSRMRMGLTGTPIENSLSELKALFDILLPEYLGGDFSFRKQYIVPIERQRNKEKTEELRKVINPFMLRRTKEQVLSELPPKIEDIRKCELSPDQLKLYKKTIEERAQSLIAQLYDENEKVPYIHIFAVLNTLKQVCNHPAQLENGELDYNKYQSGKWNLFCELLEESLNSGFKVVVFSQYLNMLALIEQYLTDREINFATIKGATINRKEMIDRFNNDPDCKVFTGSLRAAGQGIDLIGGSVVIHYDRWWNAAVEDQATDRVHRIGQTRGVQVFKLVTDGTLEEKIDKIISKKKRLMDELIREDDAKVAKQFSRNELIDLLTYEKKEDIF
ncbi:hypothetical protein B6I21_08110 [candidate division KSB1 bacterium 4572_119]|nr:MAG: hypothetical protein B6I21_08110 [candidate division KSB1 bacterium 4572_119]